MSSGLRTQLSSTVISSLTLNDTMRQGSVPKLRILLCMRMLSPGSSSRALPVTVNEQVSCLRDLLNNKRAMSLAIA